MLRSTLFAGITSFADLLLLVLLIYAGRLLGTEDFGRLAFGLAMSTVIIYVINLGLDSVSIRRIAVHREEVDVVIGSVLAGKLVVALLCLGLYMLLVQITVDDPLTRQVANILGLAGVMRSINLTLRAFLHAQERFREESIVVLTERLLVLILGGALLFTTGELLSFVIAFPIARVIGFVLLIGQLDREVPRATWTFDSALLLSMLRQGLPLGVAIISLGLYGQVDMLLLTAFMSPADVGEFAAGYRLFEGLLILPSVLTIVIYPRLAVLASGNSAKYRDLFVRGIKYVTVLAVPLVVVGVMLSDEIIELLYGEGFAPGAQVLRLLLVALLFLFVHSIVDTALRSRALEHAVMIVNASSLAAKIALGLLLIPPLGIQGAAIAGIGGSAVMLLTGFTALGWRSLPFRDLTPVLGKTLLAAGAMFLCISYAFSHNGASHLVVVVGAALVTYAAVLLFAKILDDSEWTAVRGLIPFRS